MNVNETSYRNMSVSGVDDVFTSFNGRAQRKHESHDVHPLQWIDLKKNTQNHRVYCKIRRCSWICFGSNIWKSTCCLVQSVQSQLLLLKAFPPPAAPCFWTTTRRCCSRRQMPTPREASRYPAWSQSQLWKQRRGSQLCLTPVIPCDSLAHRPTMAHPSNWPIPAGQQVAQNFKSNHSFNGAVLPHFGEWWICDSQTCPIALAHVPTTCPIKHAKGPLVIKYRNGRGDASLP